MYCSCSKCTSHVECLLLASRWTGDCCLWRRLGTLELKCPANLIKEMDLLVRMGRAAERYGTAVASTEFLEIKMESQEWGGVGWVGRWRSSSLNLLMWCLFILRVSSVESRYRAGRQCWLSRLSHDLNITCGACVLFCFYIRLVL